MRKIPTIFVRDGRYVIDELTPGCEWVNHGMIDAKEKLDGTNVRLTVRDGTLVRLEKRRNPSRAQQEAGLITPWYVDAREDDPNDRWIWEAARATDVTEIQEGEWSAEALGPKIQGNPLGLENHRCVVFSFGEAPLYFAGPCGNYDFLKTYLRNLDSLYSPGHLAEGLVVYEAISGRWAKIKRKDFDYR